VGVAYCRELALALLESPESKAISHVTFWNYQRQLNCNGQRQRKLKRCRELLGVRAAAEPIVAENAADLLKRLTGVDVHQCPVCGLGQMRRKQELESAYALFRRARLQPAFSAAEGVAV